MKTVDFETALSAMKQGRWCRRQVWPEDDALSFQEDRVWNRYRMPCYISKADKASKDWIVLDG